MSFKGLANYPVFILTVVSLIAISYLSLTLLNKLAETSNTIPYSSGSEKQLGASVSYRVVDGKLYVKAMQCSSGEVYEVVVLSNKTSIEVKLNYTSGVYGPLYLPEDSEYVFLVERCSGKTRILDALKIVEVPDKLVITLDKYMPPSLALNLGRGSLAYLESLNKKSWFYELKPYTYEETLSVEYGKAYVVNETGTYVTGEVPSVYVVRNESVAYNTPLDTIFYELVNTYGDVIEVRRYVLNIYERGARYLNPVLVTVYKPVTSNVTIIEQRFGIDSLSLVEETLANTSIAANILGVAVRDIYGNTYAATISLQVYLEFSKGSELWRVLLINTTFTTGNVPSTLRSLNYTRLDPGGYDVALLVKYTIVLRQAVFQQPYFTASLLVYGGFTSYSYAKLYAYDKLRVLLSNTTLEYTPVLNKSSVVLAIRGVLVNGSIRYIINEAYYADSFTVEYTGLEDILVVDYVKPSSQLMLAPHIELSQRAGSAKVYLINATSMHKLYGLYFTESWIEVVLKYYPVIKTRGEYVVLNTSENVYLLNTTSGYVAVFSGEVHALTSVTGIYGFIVVGAVGYENPLLLVDSGELKGHVVVKYVDGVERVYVLSNGSSVYSLRNTILASLVLVLENSVESRLLVSITGKVPVALATGSSVIAVKEYSYVNMLGKPLLTIYSDLGLLVYPWNTFG